jgi:hypothetical protein
MTVLEVNFDVLFNGDTIIFGVCMLSPHQSRLCSAPVQLRARFQHGALRLSCKLDFQLPKPEEVPVPRRQSGLYCRSLSRRCSRLSVLRLADDFMCRFGMFARASGEWVRNDCSPVSVLARTRVRMAWAEMCLTLVDDRENSEKQIPRSCGHFTPQRLSYSYYCSVGMT